LALPQSLETQEDTPIELTLTGLGGNGSPLEFEVTADPVNGTLSGIPPDLIYTPNADFHGTDTFLFRSNDDTETSPESTFTLIVLPVNDPPVVSAQSLETNEGQPIEICCRSSSPAIQAMEQ
jgi:large repetitive protein